MDLEHSFHGGEELANGDDRAVDQYASAAVRCDVALHDQLDRAVVRIEIDADFLELRSMLYRQMKDRLGGHLLAPAANRLRRAARAAQELERVDQQRLPGARLAGQDVQP